jgi:hypothetical protein
MDIISKEGDFIKAVTYLVAKWIEKHHPEPQFSLVVRKGLSFVKKACGEDFDKFKGVYEQYVE